MKLGIAWSPLNPISYALSFHQRLHFCSLKTNVTGQTAMSPALSPPGHILRLSVLSGSIPELEEWSLPDQYAAVRPVFAARNQGSNELQSNNGSDRHLGTLRSPPINPTPPCDFGICMRTVSFLHGQSKDSQNVRATFPNHALSGFDQRSIL